MEKVVEIIKLEIGKILKDWNEDSLSDFSISVPHDITHGDFTSNIAFLLSNQLRKPPMEIAKNIAEALEKNLDIFGSIEIVKPGYINFWLSRKYLITRMEKMITEADHIGIDDLLKGKKIMVEFTDPNPFKEFHIGHLYSNIVGESLCRLMEAQGAEVRRVCYQGDIGLHVAKAIWGIKTKLHTEKLSVSVIESKELKFIVKFLGNAYTMGANAFEKDEKAKNEIISINKKLYTQEDPEIMELYTKGREWSLAQFEHIYQRLGTKFWKYYFESEAGKIGLKLVNEHLQDGIFQEDSNAIVFRGEPFGLHTRVFVNSQGLPTYEAKELGLAPTKFNDFPYDQSIIITGNEVNEYFKVLLKALSLINLPLAEKTVHISHGMVRLPSGKMSSRTGNIVTGDELLDEAKTKAYEKIKEAKHTGEVDSSDDLNTIADQVGIGAVKYALLKSSIGKDVEFDFEKSVSFEGNAGPYVQYTYVRTQSILGKKGIGQADFSNYMPTKDEENLLRMTMQFHGVVSEASKQLSPGTVSSYIYELSKLFNLFYQRHRIVDAEEKDQVEFRLHLTSLVGFILQKGLSLLGIAAPKRM